LDQDSAFEAQPRAQARFRASTRFNRVESTIASRPKISLINGFCGFSAVTPTSGTLRDIHVLFTTAPGLGAHRAVLWWPDARRLAFDSLEGRGSSSGFAVATHTNN
jgi:hypothetical protein